jgi:hypothetical protein
MKGAELIIINPSTENSNYYQQSEKPESIADPELEA